MSQSTEEQHRYYRGSKYAGMEPAKAHYRQIKDLVEDLTDNPSEQAMMREAIEFQFRFLAETLRDNTYDTVDLKHLGKFRFNWKRYIRYRNTYIYKKLDKLKITVKEWSRWRLFQ